MSTVPSPHYAEISGTDALARVAAFCLALAAFCLALLALSAGASAKSLDRHIPVGFNANDIAVNEATGQLYLTGEDRVLRLASDGTPELSWGKDVIAGNSEQGYEICVVASDECKSGASGQAKGEFIGGSSPGGIAVDQTDGSVYVWDTRTGNSASQENLRVQKFDADGNFILMFGKGVNATTGGDVCTELSGDVCQAGLDTSEPGGFGNPSVTTPGIAVSPIDGDVFIADSGGLTFESNRIQRFRSDGTFVEQFGGPAQFSIGRPDSIAIDSRGIVYANGGKPAEAGEIERYDAYGVHGAPGFLAPISSPPLLAASDAGVGFSNANITKLEVDLDTDGGGPDVDTLFVLRDPDADGAETVVQQFDSPGEVAAPAAVDETHGSGDGFFRVLGFGFDPTSGDLYVAAASDIWALTDGGDGIEPPDVTDPTAANVTATTADLSAEVDPTGGEVTYRFEYSPLGEDWISLPERTISGSGFQQVDEPVSGLQPNATYRVRIIVEKIVGPEQIATAGGNEATFLTDPHPPDVETLTTSQRGPTGARIYGRINPNNSATTYWFEWGSDASYGNRVPVPDGDAGSDFGERVVFEQLEGLDPETTYHYRLVADNGVEAAPGDTEVEGADQTFTTRAAPAPAGERAYEMITPPFKPMRGLVHTGKGLNENLLPGIPSLDGDSIAWRAPFLPFGQDVVDVGSGDQRLSRRTPQGWASSTRNTLAILDEGQESNPAFFQKHHPMASSGDLGTVTWGIGGGSFDRELIASEGDVDNRLYTRRDDTGIKGFTPWLSNPEEQLFGPWTAPGGNVHLQQDMAILNDPGTVMVRQGLYRGLGGPGDPSDQQLTTFTATATMPSSNGGASIYRQAAKDADLMPSAPKELVNECTGTGQDATVVPARVGTGDSAEDVVSGQQCEDGTVTSIRGASIGSTGVARLTGSLSEGWPATLGTSATAMSNDGRRVFFTSPDVVADGAARAGCNAGAAGATDCPPQLFVRSYDSDGDPVVRWISRSRSEPVPGEPGAYTGEMIEGQQVALVGAGVSFQGASRDGSVVYFKTNAPLTPDDPNDGCAARQGSPLPCVEDPDGAKHTSWDLYRYELPPGPDADPGDGVLTRISGGPDGTADPGTNHQSTSEGSRSPAGSGGALRYHSDDGSRAYIVTTSPIAGADTAPPAGGSTAPGGEPGNVETRNLYLFDGNKTGADRYRFIARIPFHTGSAADPGGNAHCASYGLRIEGGEPNQRSNCFRGTRDGRAVIFTTPAQITNDDDDDAIDIYLYDAGEDELVRVSAPPAGEAPWPCIASESAGVIATCNGELARNDKGTGIFQPHGEPQSMRGWAGMRYWNVARDADGVVSVYFTSRLELIPEDTNGEYADVYQWREGELSLISPGNTNHHSWFSGNSLDGRDVFMVTGARLDPRELDDHDFDLYDARIGGGIPYTPPPVPCDVLALECEDEAIEGAEAGAPQTLAGGPSGNLPPGRARPSRCAKLAGNARKTARNAKRLRRAAKRAKGPRARKLAKRAGKAARNARRTSRGARRCRRRARGASKAKKPRQANRNRRAGR